jgi:plastocyanin
MALVTGFALSVALLSACSGGSDEEAEDEAGEAIERNATVTVSGFLFRPESITVDIGSTVTWENSDQILHTATSGTPVASTALFDGQMEGAGTSFAFTFREPGRFPFFCTRHPHMTGEVIVR